MAAQGIERFVVIFLFQVRQLVHHDHPQKGFRCIAKDGRDADLRLSLQLAALHAGDGGMQAERVFQHVDLVVVHHLVDRRGALQILAFQILRILPEGFVSREIMRARVAFFQHRAELSRGDQVANLG